MESILWCSMIHQGRPCNQMGRAPFPQCASPLSSEYIRGVWATESSDTRRWIEVVMNLVSNSNSWTARDKTNKERGLLAEGGEEMLAVLSRTFTDKARYRCIAIGLLLSVTPAGTVTHDPKFMYSVNFLPTQLDVSYVSCWIVSCPVFPPGCTVLLTCSKKRKKKTVDGNSWDATLPLDPVLL